ncbi:hypothetical protein K9M48_00695 [Candidatus Gracilibacteria bacterium]|nr:hypothetical protein [Candidatus Gracilibacteria bacterium]
MEKHMKIYKKRVNGLIKLFDKEDIDWMSKKNWIESMLNFKLGDNFFLSVLIEDDDKLSDFVNQITTSWADKIINQRNPKNDDERIVITTSVLKTSYLLGTEIDPKYVSDRLTQQKYLDYVWWKKIRSLLSSPSRMQTVSDEKKIALRKKAKSLLRELF